MKLKNPEKDPLLYGHIGIYQKSVDQTVRHDRLEEILGEIPDVMAKPDQKWLIVVCCRKGRHQSTAVACLLEHYFEEYLYNNRDFANARIDERMNEDDFNHNLYMLHLSDN
jgi:rhodanese-related sulfurtransferase